MFLLIHKLEPWQFKPILPTDLRCTHNHNLHYNNAEYVRKKTTIKYKPLNGNLQQLFEIKVI